MRRFLRGPGEAAAADTLMEFLNPQLAPERAQRWFIGLTVGLTLFQLLFIASSPWQLAPDEAHYWEWSRRLDWNYYSKGPAVAALIALSTGLLGDTAFAVRLPAVLCIAAMGVMFFLAVREVAGATLALLAFIALRSTMFFATAGLVMTTDPPAFLCWSSGLYFLVRAIKRGESASWIGVGLAFGCATLSKYTAGYMFPLLLVFLAVSPRQRFHLRSFGLYSGVVLYLLCLAPIFYWNSQHQWVSLAHNSAHLVSSDARYFNPKYIGELFGGQLVAIGPLLLLGILWGYWQGLRRYRAGDDLAGVLAVTGLPLLLLCFVISLTKRVYLNWPMPTYLSGLLLLAYIISLEGATFRYARKINLAILLSLGLTIGAFIPILDLAPGFIADKLPTNRLVGWDKLGARVASTLEQQSDLARAVITDDYGVASEISFHVASRPETYCFNEGSRRMNQYDIWGGWHKLKDQHLLIVLKYPSPGPELSRRFVSIKQLAQPLEIKGVSSTIRTFYFFRGEGFSGEPPVGASKF